MAMPKLIKNASTFWDSVYENGSQESTGRPSTALEKYAENRTAGRALDLGCAKGDDAIWLARKGWQVTAADISQTALNYAQKNAENAEVADRITFECRDFSTSFPTGKYDLVTALFLQTPLAFPRAQVLNRAAHAVTPGGLLLIVAHGSRAPWSWSDPDTTYSTAMESLEELKLELSQWSQIFVGPNERTATGPEGQTAMVTDSIIAIERQ
ncbi:MAG: class I SAM-dependent methyltransferase [Stappiaceae bacterium]